MPSADEWNQAIRKRQEQPAAHAAKAEITPEKLRQRWKQRYERLGRQQTEGIVGVMVGQFRAYHSFVGSLHQAPWTVETLRQMERELSALLDQSAYLVDSWREKNEPGRKTSITESSSQDELYNARVQRRELLKVLKELRKGKERD